MAVVDFFLRRPDGRAGVVTPQPLAGRPVTPLSTTQRFGIGASLIATILGGLYAREGGFVDNPHDRGGATRWGVTEAVARQEGYVGRMQDFPKHCDTKQPVCADSIYTKRYITLPGYMPFASMEPAVLDELVDSGVLHGPARGSKWLQQSLNELCASGLTVDGQVGSATIGAYQRCQTTQGKVGLCVRMLNSLDAKQEAFFRAIVRGNPSQQVFLKGWLAHRIGNVPRSECRP